MKHFLIIILTSIILFSIFYNTDGKCKVKEGFGLDFIMYPICIVIGIGKFLGGSIICIVWFAQCLPVLPSVLKWAIAGFMCGLTGIFNLPQCFLWYLLEWIGWVLYLPFRLLFYLMDLAMKAIIGKEGVVYVEHQIWCALEEMDKILHKMNGMHIIHYPDSVINKCYTCKMPSFPKLPKFPQYGLDMMTNAFNC